MAKKTSRVDAIWAQMEKHHGDYLLSYEQLTQKSKAVSTNSYALDEALGIWGVPMGRLVQFAGRESSGKTFMSLQVIKKWQELAEHNWAYFIDAEFAFDRDWAEVLGVDMERLKVFPCNDGVEIFTSLTGVPDKKDHTKPKSKPGLLDIIKDNGGAEDTGMGIIVLDSIASIIPPMEASSEPGKNNMALMGRFMPPELRKLTKLLAQTGVMFIAINQVRVNPGQLYGNPETTPGGSAWKHHCSTMINFAQLTAADTRIENEHGDPIGHRIKARIDKHKVSMSKGKTCEFDIGYVQGVINQHKELMELGIKHGLIARPNNRTYEYNGNKWVGKDNMAEYFQEETNASKLLEQIRQESAKTIKIVDLEEEESENGTD